MPFNRVVGSFVLDADCRSIDVYDPSVDENKINNLISGSTDYSFFYGYGGNSGFESINPPTSGAPGTLGFKFIPDNNSQANYFSGGQAAPTLGNPNDPSLQPALIKNAHKSTTNNRVTFVTNFRTPSSITDQRGYFFATQNVNSARNGFNFSYRPTAVGWTVRIMNGSSTTVINDITTDDSLSINTDYVMFLTMEGTGTGVEAGVYVYNLDGTLYTSGVKSATVTSTTDADGIFTWMNSDTGDFTPLNFELSSIGIAADVLDSSERNLIVAEYGRRANQ